MQPHRLLEFRLPAKRLMNRHPDPYYILRHVPIDDCANRIRRPDMLHVPVGDEATTTLDDKLLLVWLNHHKLQAHVSRYRGKTRPSNNRHTAQYIAEEPDLKHLLQQRSYNP